MSTINRRIFGTPIQGTVKKKLEDRQRIAGKPGPGESISAVFQGREGALADLSSRTPFVRMWSGIKYIPDSTQLEYQHFNDDFEEERIDLTTEEYKILMGNAVSNQQNVTNYADISDNQIPSEGFSTSNSPGAKKARLDAFEDMKDLYSLYADGTYYAELDSYKKLHYYKIDAGPIDSDMVTSEINQYITVQQANQALTIQNQSNLLDDFYDGTSINQFQNIDEPPSIIPEDITLTDPFLDPTHDACEDYVDFEDCVAHSPPCSPSDTGCWNPDHPMYNPDSSISGDSEGMEYITDWILEPPSYSVNTITGETEGVVPDMSIPDTDTNLSDTVAWLQYDSNNLQDKVEEHINNSENGDYSSNVYTTDSDWEKLADRMYSNINTAALHLQSFPFSIIIPVYPSYEVDDADSFSYSVNTITGETEGVDPFANPYAIISENRDCVLSGDCGDPEYEILSEIPSHLRLQKPVGYQIVSRVYTEKEQTLSNLTRVYMVGDHTYQKDYGVVNPNDSTWTNMTGDIGNNEEYISLIKDILPPQLQNNNYLKPQAGIKSVSCDTEGSLGTVKKTTINFIVHNFEDFDKIYNRYFLKPGATVFVDFGWSSVKELYNPHSLLKQIYGEDEMRDETEEEAKQNITNFLYGKDGQVTNNNGDLEVIQGIVTDYDAKIQKNGSVECSITLTSSNNALLNFGLSYGLKKNIEIILKYQVLQLGLASVLPKNKGASALLSLHAIGDLTATEMQNLQINMRTLALNNLGSINLTPGDRRSLGVHDYASNSIRTGVFVDSVNADNIYISWGFFEDQIVNAYFGHGKNADEINEGENGSIRMDSRDSFTTFEDQFVKKQKLISRVPGATPPHFIYPAWWGNSDLFKKGLGSYSYQVGKYPLNSEDGYPSSVFVDKDDENFENYTSGEETPPVLMTGYDIANKRIPIREVFINTKTIIEAFDTSDTVKKAIIAILGKINDESEILFDWKLARGQNDNEMSVVDNNKVASFKPLKDGEEGQSQFRKMFTFDIMSPNSIVKDYDINFKLPTGNIGNMYAIQGMVGHDSKLYPISKEFDEAVATAGLDESALSIAYEPFFGGLRAQQLSNNNHNSDLFGMLEDGSEMFHQKHYSPAADTSTAWYPDNDDNSFNVSRENLVQHDFGLKEDNAIDPNSSGDSGDNVANTKLSNEQINELIKINNEKIINMGGRLAKSWEDYFKIRGEKTSGLRNLSNLLPFTLSLTTYGIGNIVPGDTFKVNYLPEIYQQTVYLQTMKTRHSINSDGWYTTLETQFRTKPETKVKYYGDDFDDSKGVYISPRQLANLGLHDLYWTQGDYASVFTGREYKEDDWKIDMSAPINDFFGYMTYLKIIDGGLDYKYIDMVLEFTVSPDWKVPGVTEGSDYISSNLMSRWPMLVYKTGEFDNTGWASSDTPAGPSNLTISAPGISPKASDLAGKRVRLLIQGKNWCWVAQDNFQYIPYLDFRTSTRPRTGYDRWKEGQYPGGDIFPNKLNIGGAYPDNSDSYVYYDASPIALGGSKGPSGDEMSELRRINSYDIYRRQDSSNVQIGNIWENIEKLAKGEIAVMYYNHSEDSFEKTTYGYPLQDLKGNSENRQKHFYSNDSHFNPSGVSIDGNGYITDSISLY